MLRSKNSNEHPTELSMENLYLEWSLEDDKILWENRQESPVELAAMLGRGLNGVTARLDKLKDVNSPAYERLFAQGKTQKEDETNKKSKLVPVSEVLRRIQWDYSLSASDFSLLHYDRVEDKVMESPMDTPNTSIKGKSTLLVDALPEHRIVAVKYKEQIVWDHEKRLDRFFGNEGIEEIIATYDEWKQKKDSFQNWLRQRQTEVATKVRQILGLIRYDILKAMSTKLQAALDDPSVSAKDLIHKYVKDALELFRQVQNDPSTSLEPMLIPRSDIEAVECFSELVALSPSPQLRHNVLEELAIVLRRLEGKSNPQDAPANRGLPEISEDDLEESFVRGSGPGGQKINKTNNRVLLIHKPTQLRVECQETRSLQQNRKIARKRMRLKLDEFLNGSQSRTSIKAEKASSKKAKAKAKSRARNRRKAAAKEAASKDSEQDGFQGPIDYQ
jgi:uncharacterized protein (UPF0248 family)